MDDFEVIGRVVVDASGASTLQSVNNSLDSMQSKSGGVSSVFSALGNVAQFVWGNIVLQGINAVGHAIGDFASGIMAAGAEAQDVQAQLNAVLQSTGGAAGMSADAINALSTSLSHVTKFSDEAITSAQSMLLTFTNVGKDVFPDATKAILDMSQAMGTDLKGTAIQVGKALNDPIKGITALSRVGVTFTEEQKEVIKKLVETGHAADAQKLILAELSKEFGGSAAAAGKTFSGSMEILKNMLGEVQESIFNAMLPSLTELGGKLVEVLNNPIVQEAIKTLVDFFGVLFKAAMDLLMPVLDDFLAWLNSSSSLSDALFNHLGPVGDVLKDLWDAVQNFSKGDLAAGFGSLGDAAKDAWKAIKEAFDSVDWGEILFNMSQNFQAGMSNLLGGKDAGTAIGQGASKLGKFLLTELGNAGKNIKDFAHLVDWKGLGKDLEQGIKSIDWKTMGMGLKDLGDGLNQGIGLLLIGLGQALWEAISEIDWKALDAAAGDAAATFLAGLMGIDWSETKKTWENNFKAMAFTFHAVKDIIDEKLASIKLAFELFLPTLARTWTEAWNGMKDRLSEAWSEMVSKVQTFGTNVAHEIDLAISDWVAKITGFIPGIMKDWQTGWDNMVAEVATFATDVLGKIQSGISDWEAEIKGAATTLYNAAVDMINGIWNGITKAWGDMLADFGDLVDMLPQAIKDILGISSPSKVFMELGKHIIGGLNAGLLGGMTIPVKTLMTLSTGMAQVFAPNSPTMSLSSQTNGLAGGGVGGTTGTVHNHYYYGPVYQGKPGENDNDDVLFKLRK